MNILIYALAGFLLSLAFNWILIRFSINLGVRNISKEDEVRWQQKKPSIGGLTFYITFLIFFSVLSIIFRNDEIFDDKLELSMLVMCTVAFVIGLIDDARNTNPILKLLGQIICGIILTVFGYSIEISPSVFWNNFVTVLWVVFLMNSINMLDNMDGLATLISVFIIAAMSINSFSYSSFYIIHVVTCVGVLFGFLFYNWKPSKIYMGDSGSQFLGAFLAHISVIYIWNFRIEDGGYFQVNQFFLPFLFFTIPIFDTTTVFIHRLLRRKSPFVGGKDHLSHHFVYLGFKDHNAVLCLGLINLFFVFLSMWVFHTTKQYILYVFFVWVIAFLIIQYFYIKAKKKSSD